MKRIALLFSLIITTFTQTFAQNEFDYELVLEPVVISNFPGIHSFAYAQADGKWLIIGGRIDGIHARQPFNAFPENKNNKNIFVVDPISKQVWSKNIDALPTSIKEQVQSTNMCFIQDADTLYIAGGYAFSQTANDHITFPSLLSIQVSDLIQAVIADASISSHFKQVNSDLFAVTGGYFGKINDTYYLVGGHRFDGRYNPMGNATYVQTYTNSIRKFKFNSSGTGLTFSNEGELVDEIHLHRRDYNLIPQIFADGSQGYSISSGVFQYDVDLPYLYPVDIRDSGITPNMDFSQYLSNYHSAKVSLFDQAGNTMHHLFFGGMSQYKLINNVLQEDQTVPFVKTISRLSRYNDNSLHEFQFEQEMPGLKGSSAEFIHNHNMSLTASEIILLNNHPEDTLKLGYIVGGILAPTDSPFTNNETTTTIADTSIYLVKLIRTKTNKQTELDVNTSFSFEVYPNPSDGEFDLVFSLKQKGEVRCYISDMNGKIIEDFYLKKASAGKNKNHIQLNKEITNQTLTLTLVLNEKYYHSKKITIK